MIAYLSICANTIVLWFVRRKYELKTKSDQLCV